ncbi:MAG: hypothetical protein EOO02_12505, partial [Chitinophagaceae bacterium]
MFSYYKNFKSKHVERIVSINQLAELIRNNPHQETILQLHNEGPTTIPYKDVTIRYWLTVEEFAAMTNLFVDYAQLGTARVKMKYVKLGQPRQG